MKKDDLLEAMDDIYLSDDAKNKIMNRAINYKNQKEVTIMSKKKLGLIAVVAIMMMSITVGAAGKIASSWLSSSSIPTYTTLPSEQQCIKDIGYAPALTEKFENGYVFDNAHLIDGGFDDEAGNTIESFKAIGVDYKKGDDTLFLNAEKYDSAREKEGNIIATVGNIDISYIKYTNKIVPADYELTEEDKIAEQNGDLVFSYGSDDVSISEVQGLSWTENDIHYNFTQMDGKLTQDELVSMAAELINNN